MKRKITILLFVAFVLSLTLVALTSCGNNEVNGNNVKQVPVYQGMTITPAKTTATATALSYLSSDKDNGNHNGHFKGDHSGKNEEIDEENPFPDDIEQEINSSLNVIGSLNEIYYATPNEDIYINIHIDNPDSFEIISFTLNGKKYSSYMFEDGSDMETIVLKYNVGNTSGIVEYTIDAIKYIDGTEVKDVLFDGNKTVMAGIKTANQVTASVTYIDIDTNAIYFKASVEDNNELVAFSKGVLKAVLYDGSDIVSEKDIAIGDNSVSFERLRTNTLYQYAIVGYYDDLSGSGFGMNILYKDTFYTESIVLFDNITVEQECISFELLWHEDHQGKAISALKLYRGENFVKEISANAANVSELLSNTNYRLVAEYPNGESTESIQLEFTTLEKSIPSFSFTNEIITKNSIDAEYAITDSDDVLLSYKIELYKDERLVCENGEKKISFSDLDYYSEYTLKITYSFNLNDGNGEQTSIFEKSYKTLVYIEAISCNVANTAAIRAGDIIFIQLGLDNPLGMTVESVVINGQSYAMTGVANGNKAFVEILCDDSFAGGLTEFSVDKINTKIDEITYTLIPKDEQSCNVFINGTVTILGKYTANTNFELIEWGVCNQPVYRVIKIDNPTGYNISLTDDSIILHKIDENTYYYEDTLELDYGSGGGWDNGCYVTVQYENQHMSGYAGTKLDYSYEKSCYVLESDEIKYISNVNDLLNMNGRHYFKMTNDIDLSGVNWTGAKFQGVFDANGYAIKNMSIVGSNPGSLFSQAHGIIQNLDIVNATIVTKYTGNSIDSACGIIVGTGHAIYIRNCNIDNSSTLNTAGISYVGGICGRADYATRIENCQVNAQITTDQYESVQGISNSCNTNSLVILNCLYTHYQSTDDKTIMLNSYCSNADVTAAHLNSKDFYIKTLGWSDSIWDLSNLDVEDGKYATLKHQ